MKAGEIPGLIVRVVARRLRVDGINGQHGGKRDGNDRVDAVKKRAQGARRLRIVAFGFVDREGGSVASASYLTLERLLGLGHAVEFHAAEGFIVPTGLIDLPGFTYLPTKVGPAHAGWGFLERTVPARLRAGIFFGYRRPPTCFYARAIAALVRRRHAADPFDVLLVLGTLPPFRVPGLPCVCWPQGAPNGEWEALRSLRRPGLSTRRRGGLPGASPATYKQAIARRGVRRSDVLLCGSDWSVENWVRLGARRGLATRSPIRSISTSSGPTAPARRSRA